MIAGSLQLRQYLDLRAGGNSLEIAATQVGMSFAEAKLTDAANDRGEIDLPPWPLNHNQPETEEPKMAEGTVAADELRLLIERWERLDEERKAIADDQKDVLAEAKSRGYDTKTIRRIIRLRKMETHVLQESEALLQTYASALGMQLAFL